jgi:hypothetical protein
MKRFELVQKLINEGLSEKTLVNLSDKQLVDLAERMLTDLSEQKKGSVVMSGSTTPNDLKKYTDQGINVELREKKSGVGPKVTKGHNGIPEFMDSKELKGEKKKEGKKKKSETKEWVESLAEGKFFHILTSKNEIMEMISSKINEVNNTKFPDMFKWNTLKSMDGEIKEGGTTTKPAPVKPKVDPGTAPKPSVIPQIIPKQRPKAERDPETSPKKKEEKKEKDRDREKVAA